MELCTEEKNLPEMSNVDVLLTSRKFKGTIHVIYKEKCFQETSYGIRDALSLLGIPSIVYEVKDYLPIFFDNAQLFIVLCAHAFQDLPCNCIIFNLEQISSPWMTKRYGSYLQRALAVCDFAEYNIQSLRQCLNLHRTIRLPVYIPRDSFTGHHHSPKTVDVLFYGAANTRRVEMHHRLQSVGVKTEFHFNYALFDEERTEAISRARIVLNLHFYPAASLEVHRIMPLLAAGSCVVSEPSADPFLNSEFCTAITFAKYDDIVNAVVHLLQSPEERVAFERAGKKLAMSIQDNVEPLCRAIDIATNFTFIQPK